MTVPGMRSIEIPDEGLEPRVGMIVKIAEGGELGRIVEDPTGNYQVARCERGLLEGRTPIWIVQLLPVGRR